MPLRFCIGSVMLATLLSAVPGLVYAGLDEESISYTFHFFTDVDGVNVSTHYSEAGLQLSNRMTMSLLWAHDVVSIPGIDAPPGSQEAADAITTASRPIAGSADAFSDFVKIRDEVTAATSWKGCDASYYASQESDYFAQMVTVGLSRDLRDNNFNVSAGVSYGWDDIRPLADDDTQAIPEYQKTVHANLVVTQVLTPTTVVRVGGEMNHVQGLQHDPYRNVYVGGTNVPEAHPTRRERWDVFVQGSQYLSNRSSVKIDYRYYTDDWNLASHTIGGRLSQYVTDEFVVQYRYRYYKQGSAYFYRADYAQPGGVDGFQTGDYRLGAYGAHLFGGNITWFPHHLMSRVGFMKHARLDFSYERYVNSNNFSANIYETGLRIFF